MVGAELVLMMWPEACFAVTVIVIFLIGWGAGIVFFLGIKQKTI
ncbi:membrane protein [Escherichia coli]|nr:hypothetical membrane protein [Escherichia coli IHE3034]AJM73161.1 membrane protein [Escherichia coli RS218]AKK41982.1 membrane protein [Escherichia coli]KIE75080.1 membrane protein [Escherichia coli]KKA61464.1 hypothetical protein EC91649_1158 [Escherichia coli 9.1649]